MPTHPLISDQALLAAAGKAAFGRGSRYCKDGRVEALSIVGPRAQARVVGTLHYDVTLVIVEHAGHVEHRCDCPAHARGAFCKHCVAVALVWAHAPVPESAEHVPLRMVALAVASQARVIVGSPITRQPQALETPASTSVEIGELRARLTAAFRVSGGFVEYSQMPRFTARIHGAIEMLEDFLSEETATDTIKLCEQNLKRVERTFERVDDSRGDMRPIQHRLCDLHLRAVLAAKPAPVKLADRLFAWEMESEWETFLDAYFTYAVALGEAGRRRYRELAAACWAELNGRARPAGAGVDFYGHFALRRLVRRLAIEDGDPAAIVDAFGPDLTSEHDYLRLVEALEQAGRADLARYWADRGIEQLPTRLCGNLRDHVASREAAGGRADEAVEIAWEAYLADPSCTGYSRLYVYATIAGRWPEFSERAIAELEAQAEHGDAAAHARYELLDVLIWDRSLEEALAFVSRFGVGIGQAMRLGQACEPQRPVQAATIYMSFADEMLRPANRKAYQQTAQLLARCKSLLAAAGQTDRFAAVIEDVRSRHGRKSSFMPMIEDL